MHGKNRDEYKLKLNDNTVRTILEKKAISWYQLMNELLLRRDNSNSNSNSNSNNNNNNADNTIDDTASTDTTTTTTNNNITLQLNEKALTVNPDPLWLWTIRRDIIYNTTCSTTNSSSKSDDTTTTTTTTSSNVTTTDTNTDTTGTTNAAIYTTTNNTDSTTLALCILQKELVLTSIALQNNPKAYGPWHHRKYCLSCYLSLSSTTTTTTTTTTTNNNNNNDNTTLLLQNELQLTAQFLMLDERNFHCWSYRRFIVSCLLKLMSSSNTNNTNNTIFDGSWTIPSNNNNNNNDSSNSSSSSSSTECIFGAQIINTTNISNNTTMNCNNTNDINTTMTTATTTTIADTIVLNYYKTIVQNEWDYTSTKIYNNFSNNSAFHYRSILFPFQFQFIYNSTTRGSDNNTQQQEQVQENVKLLIENEFLLISNAIFTEPDDQTIWWYQHYLYNFFTTQYQYQYLQQMSTTRTCTTTIDTDIDNDKFLLVVQQQQPNVIVDLEIIEWFYTHVIPNHIEQLHELLNEICPLTDDDDDDDNNNNDPIQAATTSANTGTGKWVLLGLYETLETYNKYNSSSNNNNGNENVKNNNKECIRIIQKLIQIDPDRINRYKSMLITLKQY